MRESWLAQNKRDPRDQFFDIKQGFLAFQQSRNWVQKNGFPLKSAKTILWLAKAISGQLLQHHTIYGSA
jgi:hypothetical protein